MAGAAAAGAAAAAAAMLVLPWCVAWQCLACQPGVPGKGHQQVVASLLDCNQNTTDPAGRPCCLKGGLPLTAAP